MLESYLKARMAEGKKIVSQVAGKDVEISAETIWVAYELPPATKVEVRNHAYNEKEFWAVIKNPSNSTEDMPAKGKKKDLLSLFYEHILDILYKCLESRVVVVDDVNSKKMALMHAVLTYYKYDWLSMYLIVWSISSIRPEFRIVIRN